VSSSAGPDQVHTIEVRPKTPAANREQSLFPWPGNLRGRRLPDRHEHQQVQADETAADALAAVLMIHPAVLGAGERLFDDAAGKIPLCLLRARTVGENLMFLTYKIVRDS
jgi:hypothetical protein